MLLSPTPPISLSSRARTSAASWASNRLPGGSAGSMTRRFTAASRVAPSVTRLSSMPWRSSSASPGRSSAPRASGAATLLTIARLSGYGCSASRMSSFTVPAP